jgi:Ion transport protein
MLMQDHDNFNSDDGGSEPKHNIFQRMINALARYWEAEDELGMRRSMLSATLVSLSRSSAATRVAAAHARFSNVVESPAVSNFFMLAIIVNSIFLALESADMSPGLSKTLEGANVFFTWLFAVEFALQLSALGAKRYFKSLSNMFDAVVVTVSIVELLGSGAASGMSALRSLKTFRVLKSLRVLRVVRTFKYLRALSLITEVLVESIAAFSAIGMLIALFMVVFAIMGLQVYGTAELDIEFPHFHTFFASLVMVFQVRDACCMPCGHSVPRRWAQQPRCGTQRRLRPASPCAPADHDCRELAVIDDENCECDRLQWILLLSDMDHSFQVCVSHALPGRCHGSFRALLC